jgi:ABC transporter.
MNSIELINVSYRYPNGFLAVDDVSMSFKKGEAVAIIGQNGAGKTTTVKMMNNLYRPTSGTVLVNGMDTKDFTTAQISRHVGYVFQNPDDQIFQSNIEKEIKYTLKANKVPEEEANKWFELAVELTGLKDFLEYNPYNMPLSIRKFITIASVIAYNPDVIIMDEPTAGQDLIGLKRLANIISTLKGLGKTIITITHDMEFVLDNFERVIVMANKKKVADGTAKEVFWNAEVMEKAALKLPAICELAYRAGLPGYITTETELIEALKGECNGYEQVRQKDSDI